MCFYRRILYDCNHAEGGAFISRCAISKGLEDLGSSRTCEFKHSHARLTYRKRGECGKCKALTEKLTRVKQCIKKLRETLERRGLPSRVEMGGADEEGSGKKVVPSEAAGCQQAMGVSQA